MRKKSKKLYRKVNDKFVRMSEDEGSLEDFIDNDQQIAKDSGQGMAYLQETKVG